MIISLLTEVRRDVDGVVHPRPEHPGRPVGGSIDSLVLRVGVVIDEDIGCRGV